MLLIVLLFTPVFNTMMVSIIIIFSDAGSIMVVSSVTFCNVVIRDGLVRDVVGCLCRRGTLVTLHRLVAQINI